MLRALGILAFLTFVHGANAQLPLDPQDARAVNGALEAGWPSKPPLKCHIEVVKPFLDFSFRFESAYVVRCDLGQFKGRQTNLFAVLRIAPDKGSPLTLGQQLTIPRAPPAKSKQPDYRHLHNEIEFSGVFASGEGEYDVELAVFDEAKRLVRKTWRAKATLHGKEATARPALRAGEVAAISLPPWKGTSADQAGLRVAIFLDAAPMNPFSQKLRAWDRAFLLGALSSLLRQLPVSSVRLIAFNLDQQKEIFRDEDFDHLSMRRLAGALNQLELGTVSYRTLQAQGGWAELLIKLVHQENIGTDNPDAVIFLGPNNRIQTKIPPEWVTAADTKRRPYFYFEYFPRIGADFPDAIEHVTADCNGSTFKLHSPSDLAAAILKMQAKVAAKQPAMHGTP